MAVGEAAVIVWRAPTAEASARHQLPVLAIDFGYPPGVLSVEAHPLDFVLESRGHVVSLGGEGGGIYKKKKKKKKKKERESKMKQIGEELRSPPGEKRRS